MRSSLNLIFIFLLTCGLSVAQSSTTSGKAAGGEVTVLPSEATVDSFLQQTFGHDPQVSWKISSIKPAPAAGLAQVDVVMATLRPARQPVLCYSGRRARHGGRDHSFRRQTV